MFPKIQDIFSRTRRNAFRERLDFSHFLFCFLITGFFLLILSTGRLERLENAAFDSFLKKRPAPAVSPDIALIEIDKDSLQAIGPWPWPLSYHTQMIDLLKKWKARAVTFDFIFRDPPSAQEAEEFRNALHGAPHVHFPVSLENKTGKKFWVHSLPIVLEAEGEKKVWARWDPGLVKSAEAEGHVNLSPDPDTVLRRVRPFLSYEGQIYAAQGLEMGGAVLDGKISWAFSLPRDGAGNLLINWPGRWHETFDHFSYADLIRSSQAIEKGLPPVVDLKKLEGKICLIGLSAPGISAPKATPLEPSCPVFAAQAAVLNSVLTHEFLRPAGLKLNSLVLILVGFVAWFLSVLFKNVKALLASLGLGVACMLLSFWLLVHKEIWIYPFQPVLLALTLFIFSAIRNQMLASREQSRLLDLATKDGLTGLYVIRHFREISNQVVLEAQIKKEPLALILTDIDNFKNINDTYGHPCGDMVLKKTAQIIYSCFRSKRPLHAMDFVARYGGEEFVVLVRNSKLKEGAQEVAERMRKLVQDGSFEWEGKKISVTISLGVASLHEGENVPDLMVKRADEALYRAKRQGKNRVCLEE